MDDAARAQAVLIVDEDRDVETVLFPIIEALGATPVLAPSAAEARTRLAERDYACALIDQTLTDGHGLDFLPEVRRCSPGTELLLITGMGNVQAAVAALRLGAVDYIVKPYVLEMVHHRIHLALERRRMFTEAAKMERLLLHADRMASVGTLAAGVAHEINAPLSHITLNSELLAREVTRLKDVLDAGPEPAELSRRLSALEKRIQIVRDGGERVRLIVKDLRSASRGTDDAREPLDIHQVLDAALQISNSEIRWRAHVVKSYGSIPPVEGNRTRLEQVFVNLLINAAQAIPEGNPARNQIRCTTSVDASGYVVVDIKDTGSGIAPEHLDRLFDPFFTTKPLDVGTGLGLPICQGIVSSLGGVIEVSSTVGEGSTFSVQLPPAGRAMPAPARSEGRGRKRGRVMLIEDDPGVSQLISDVLAPEHEVVSLAGAEPRAIFDVLASDGAFDAILCDVMTRGMLGERLYRHLRSTGSDHARRLVFLTDPFAAKARAFLARVPNPYVEKPFHIQELTEAVSSVVSLAAHSN